MKKSRFTPVPVLLSVLCACLFFTVSTLKAEDSVLPATAIPAPLGILMRIDGSLEIRRSGQVLAAKEGDAVYAGDQLKTGASDRTLLELSVDKSQVSIAFDSVLILTNPEKKNGGQPGLSLIRGLMWGLKTSAGSGLNIKTPAADLTVLSAEYFVKVPAPDQTELVVKEGTVDIHYEEFNVRAGNMSQVTLQKGKQPMTQGITEKLLNEQWAQRFA